MPILISIYELYIFLYVPFIAEVVLDKARVICTRLARPRINMGHLQND